jgi:hypothetical protein
MKLGAQYFILSKVQLEREQYERLKEQIDKAWPKWRKRPILLECCEVIKV